MIVLLSKEFVPLYQSLLWVILVIGILILYRKEISLLRKALAQRLDSGAQVKIGPVELGEHSNLAEESKILELLKDTISEALSEVSNNNIHSDVVVPTDRNDIKKSVTSKAIDSFSRKVITIDSKSINNKSWLITYYEDRTIQDLLNSIWAELRGHFKPFTYGTDWKLLYSRNDGPYKLTNFLDPSKINLDEDVRTFKKLRIRPGDKFKVEKI